ncbi:hypothetical protein ACHAW5_000502 [Stephanodiscus triporus]|uniref:Metalloendopeptidase n=1 Tax=Stephanodiscus triporus TaxID=2934178 RepID=A0ABD3NJT0_9STRA
MKAILLLQLLACGRVSGVLRVHREGVVDGDASAPHRRLRRRQADADAAGFVEDAPSRLLQQEEPHHLDYRLDAGLDSGHHLSSDVFEGDIVVTYDDVALNYGVAVADQLADDGFVYAVPDDNGGDGVALNERLRKLDLTSEMGRTWNHPEFRRPDGKLQIPYAIDYSSPYLQGETNATIHQALATIEKSSGIIVFTPRTTELYYIYFQYLQGQCSANLGRGAPSNVYLGWCRFKEHQGEITHEVLHTLGFWHEQSRPDRDSHVSIITENIATYAVGNFAKQMLVNSLGSPYDYNSLMHYPQWAFQKAAGLLTIVPTRALQKWEVMGQCARMSPKDIEQLRLLYQCSTGSRDLASITMDNMCSAECKCWAYAPGKCNNDDDCMGDLICGTTPAVIPKGEEYLDQLPAQTSSSLPTEQSCLAFCHVNCCQYDHNIMMCPQTCNTAPPEVSQGPLPSQMCLPPTGGAGDPGTKALTVQAPSYTSSTVWFLDWSKNGGMCVADCVGDAPCWRKKDPWEAAYPTVEVCCSTMSWKPFKDCSYMLAATNASPTTYPTATPTKTPTMRPTPPPTVTATTKPTDTAITTTTTTSTTTATSTIIPGTTTTTPATTTTTIPATTTTTPATTTATTTKATTTTIPATTTTTPVTTTTTTTPGTTLNAKWYPDPSGLTKCNNDGKAPSWMHHKYDLQTTCCSSHFSWAYNDCLGVKPAPSMKWFIDWSSGKCKQDCEKTTGVSCGGLVPGAWVALHTSSDACCRAHVSYAVEQCKTL